MVLKLFNTLTRKKEPFKPAKKKQVTMYNCGPTVYSYAHIGNFRAYIFADLLRRYLEWKGYRVKQIMNITDVGHLTVDDQLQAQGEDKIEKAARTQGITPKEIADFYTMAFFEDIAKLNLKKAFFYPRATAHVTQMKAMIATLLKKGVAYKSGKNVYYEIKHFPRYGKLSGNTPRKLQAGKRVKVKAEKKSPFDFALWIHNPKHLMQWDAPWGRGYPGWHIECSAMSLAYLKPPIDIHTGGEDNIFPHHECEIAQSEGATGKTFVNYWLHTRHLLVNGKKMSKSLKNFYTLRDLLEKGYPPRAVRFLLLSGHYRTKLNFTEKGLDSAQETLSSLDTLVAGLRHLKRGKETKKMAALVKKTRRAFEKSMDDDLNIAEGLAALFTLVRETNRLLDRKRISRKNATQVLKLLYDLDHVLGLDLREARDWGHDIDREVRDLLAQREAFRKAKKWADADRIRDAIRAKGYIIEDTDQGPRTKKTLILA